MNLSLGLVGFLTVDAFKLTIQSYINENSKKILSADIAIYARREITESEAKIVREILQPEVEPIQTYDFFAMLSSPRGSRLVSIRAVDSAYPYYGDLEMESGQLITGTTPHKSLFSGKSAWAYPELKYQLGLSAGEKIKLGETEFTLDDFIVKDSTQIFRLTSLAPRVFIDRHWLQQTGLIKFGSTFSHSYLYKLKSVQDLDQKVKQIYTQIKDPAFRVDTPQTAGEDSSRQLNYLSDFLSLVSLVALVLSSLGAAYLFRLYLSRHIKDIAIYRSLGLNQESVFKIYLIQIFILGLLSLIPTVILVYVLLPLMSNFIFYLTSLRMVPTLSFMSLLLTYAVSSLSSFFVTIPYLLKLNELRPAKLFSEEKFSSDLRLTKPYVFIPALAFLYALAVWQSHSIWIGSIFFWALMALVLLLTLLSWGFFYLIKQSPKGWPWYLQIGLKSLSRRKNQSWAVFLAIASGSLLINLLPQMKTSLNNDFAFDSHSKLPSVFLFDIQDDQLESLKDHLRNENIPLLNISPLIRARILKVNGQDYERSFEPQNFKTREDEMAARSRNRGVNLSYRESLSSSEQISEGAWIEKKFDPLTQKRPLISIEKKFAERMNLHVKDILIFDVQGVEIEAEVASLRQVKWNSFQPNFFILIQDGVLNEAPKTHIAILPQLPEEKKTKIMNSLGKDFPNVSALDVRRTVEEIMQITDKMSWSLELMAALALLTGYVVLFSIVQTQIESRRWELNMYKILGSSFSQLRWILVFEFTLISLIASLCGSLFSLALGAILMHEMFDIAFKVDWATLILTVILISIISAVISAWTSRQVIREKALVLLKGS